MMGSGKESRVSLDCRFVEIAVLGWLRSKTYVKSLLVLQSFSTERKSGSISHILKAFSVRHSLEYETSDSDRKVIQNLYSQMRIHMVR